MSHHLGMHQNEFDIYGDVLDRLPRAADGAGCWDCGEQADYQWAGDSWCEPCVLRNAFPVVIAVGTVGKEGEA